MRGPIFASLLAALLCTPLQGALSPQANSTPAEPGTVNYVEGDVSIGTQALSPSSVGTVRLLAGQSLTTFAGGRAEVLLTPGVIARVDGQSSVRMISSNLKNTEIAVERGRIFVEVEQIDRFNNLLIDQDRASARLLKNGLYEFDAGRDQALTFKGKADLYEGSRKGALGAEREITLSRKFKAHDFNAKKYEDDFYRWNGLRSEYLAEANAQIAANYVNGGASWYGAGWYWDPWFSCYTFIPGDGLFYSPFGWDFFSPWFWGGPYYGYPGGGLPGVRAGFGPGGGGFRSGSGFRGGGGFHGGGGHR